MVALLSDKLHSTEYWIADVTIPACFALLLAALVASLLRLRPSWKWIDVATGAYFSISVVVMAAAYRSDFIPLMSHEGLPHLGPDWFVRLVDFTPNLMGAIFPLFLVLCADADAFAPVAGKCTKLLQLAVVAVSTPMAVYLFATQGWSQLSFHLISFGFMGVFAVSSIGTLLIAVLSWLIGVVSSAVMVLKIEVPRAIQLMSDRISKISA